MDIKIAVSNFIEQNELLAPGQRVIVGVSGGADSLCLIDILHSLGHMPVIAHLDHKIRPDSGEDAAYVAQVARELEVKLVSEERDPRPLMAEGRSLEEAARIVRYRFLVRIANKMGVRSIAVGHTADDQAETILMHLLRGSGYRGMRGMLPKTCMDTWGDINDGAGISLIRPLLVIRREDTEAYCHQRGYSPREDPTNKDQSILRNRIRHELLPFLETYNPRIREVLSRTSSIMTRWTKFLDMQVADFDSDLVLEQGDEFVLFNLEGYDAIHEALQWEFLYQTIVKISHGQQAIDYDSVSRANELLSGPDGSRVSLASGLEALRFRGLGVIRKIDARIPFKFFPQFKASQPAAIIIGQTFQLNDGWAIRSTSMEIAKVGNEEIYSNSDPNVAYLDAEALSKDIMIRACHPGDRFRPLGMDGTIKLSDYFTNEKVPQLARELWPILVEGDEIVWIVGMRTSHLYRVREDSKVVIKFHLRKLREGNETKI
jgi:tRNA(Ile)-lysidine synthase